jgi:hypothetical protein
MLFCARQTRTRDIRRGRRGSRCGVRGWVQVQTKRVWVLRLHQRWFRMLMRVVGGQVRVVKVRVVCLDILRWLKSVVYLTLLQLEASTYHSRSAIDALSAFTFPTATSSLLSCASSSIFFSPFTVAFVTSATLVSCRNRSRACSLRSAGFFTLRTGGAVTAVTPRCRLRIQNTHRL